ncbi:MAG TPA: GAF domain-containing protein, partial [Chthonomonadales bacterium]|nr:GAF domain-containing protein [Chthonomonadales bacterium]
MLNQMLRSLAPTDAPDIIARRLVALARQAIGMDLCVVTLVDAEDGVTGGSGMNASVRGGRRLSIRASAPDVNARILDEPPKDIDLALWQKLRQPTIAGQLPTLDALELEALNPLRNVTYSSLLIVPLVAGTECVGLLCGYNSSARDLTDQELLVLQTISSYAAMSIASSALLDYARTGTPVQAFFDEVLADNQPHEDVLRGRANALGYDLTQPSAMLMLEIGASSVDGKEPGEGGAGGERQLKSRRVLASVHARVKEQYPRSLIHAREHLLYCIVALEHDDGAARLDSWLTALMQEIESDYDTRLCAGIGCVCTDLRDYARGFAEALEALRIGECLRGHVASARFNQLGPYRYLSPFARDRHLSDTHLNHIEIIARYDREHKRGNL